MHLWKRHFIREKCAASTAACVLPLRHSNIHQRQSYFLTEMETPVRRGTTAFGFLKCPTLSTGSHAASDIHTTCQSSRCTTSRQSCGCAATLQRRCLETSTLSSAPQSGQLATPRTERQYAVFQTAFQGEVFSFFSTQDSVPECSPLPRLSLLVFLKAPSTPRTPT